MQQGSLITFWLATVFYAGATVLYAYNFLSKSRAYAWYATFLTGAGFLLHTASVGMRSTATHGTIMTGANSLVLAAWTLVLVYFMVEHLVKLKVYGTILVPVAAALLLLSQALGLGPTTAELSASQAHLLDSWRVGIHVVLIMLANAGFAIGAAASVAYLLMERQLKSHRTSRLFRRLPSLAQTDQLARRAIAWSYPAYTAGLLLGTVRAIETDVGGWYADPRVMTAGVVWLIFGTYLYLHYATHQSGRRVSRIAIVGFVFVVILAVIARTLPAGFHIFGALRPGA